LVVLEVVVVVALVVALVVASADASVFKVALAPIMDACLVLAVALALEDALAPIKPA
jgi:hypothetical protein